MNNTKLPPLPDDVEFFWWREFGVSAWDSAFGHTPPVEVAGKIKSVTALYTSDQMQDYARAALASKGAGVPVDCKVSVFSSRMCELGTKCCTVEHGVQPVSHE
jgi:hypothetical protein